VALPEHQHAEAVDGCASSRRDVVSQMGVLRMPNDKPATAPVGRRVSSYPGGAPMIRVSVTYGDLTVEADFESDAYSPDIVEDLTTR